MNERMRTDKEAQLVDIWVWWRRAIRNILRRSKILRLVERKPSDMGLKAIRLRLEPAKGIPTAHVLTDKWKSTLKQQKIQTHLCACHGRNGNVLGRSRGDHEKALRSMGGPGTESEITVCLVTYFASNLKKILETTWPKTVWLETSTNAKRLALPAAKRTARWVTKLTKTWRLVGLKRAVKTNDRHTERTLNDGHSTNPTR